MAGRESRRSSGTASEPKASDEERHIGILSRNISDVDNSNDEYKLKRGLKARHVSMIAMGGAVGRCLFDDCHFC
jgi:amino acid permease